MTPGGVGGPEVGEVSRAGSAAPAGGPPDALRIAVLDSWSRDPARGSGTAVAAGGLEDALRELGHDVTVLRPRDARGPGDPPPSLLHRLLYNLRLRGRPLPAGTDLLVGTDLDGAFLPASLPVPYVVMLRGVAADEAPHDRGRARLERRLAAWLERRNVARADLVTTPSRYSAGAASRAYGIPAGRVAVVPEGIDPDPWDALRETAPPPRSDPRPTVLSVARQYRRKNTRALLGALPRVAREVPDVRCRIVGGGPELPSLRRRVRALGLEGRVELLGPLPEDDGVRAEYARADCFCLPTLQESFGIVFLEAMAAGLPVVASNTSAVPEVVPHGETGLLVDPEDPDALARALVRVLTDRALAERLGRAGVARARRFTRERSARRFLEAIRPLLAPGPP